MLKRSIPILLFLAVFLGGSSAFADEVLLSTPADLNLNGVSLDATPLSNVIPMDSERGFYNQLTLVCAITWGTSIQVEAKCKGSYDGTIYGWVDMCTGLNPKVCSPLQWEWAKATNTDGLITLELRSNYKSYKCQLDDAANGSGTAVCTAGRGRQ